MWAPGRRYLLLLLLLPEVIDGAKWERNDGADARQVFSVYLEQVNAHIALIFVFHRQ